MAEDLTIHPAYVFRGTSLGYPGSTQSINIPYTCTSANPLKATLFAQAYRSHHYLNPVIYIAKTQKLTGLTRIYQRSKKMAVIEEEWAWEVLPLDFYNHYCEGYVTLDEMKQILLAMSLYPSRKAKLTDLSDCCEEIAPLDVNVIENIVAKIKNSLKK